MQATISGPSIARVGAMLTLNVTYCNLGLNDVPAPILVLSSSTGEFRLPGETAWSANTFQIMGISETGPAGILQPGYKGSFQVQYQDLNPQSVSTSEYSVGTVVSTAAANWQSLESSLDPSFIPAAAWNAIYQNLAAMLGTTWGQYQASLDADATYLGSIGQPTEDVTQLYDFEVQQAIGYSPVASLATTTDASVSTPGQLSLSFSREFGPTIMDRNLFGRFGWGWDDSWDTYFTKDSSGNVFVYEPGGSVREFQPKYLIVAVEVGSGAPIGILTGYTDQPGDYGVLCRYRAAAIRSPKSMER